MGGFLDLESSGTLLRFPLVLGMMCSSITYLGTMPGGGDYGGGGWARISTSGERERSVCRGDSNGSSWEAGLGGVRDR